MKCTSAAKRLSQGNRGPAVQNAKRLMRAFIHRHACANEVVPNLGEFNTNCTEQSMRGLVEETEIGSVVPDGRHSF